MGIGRSLGVGLLVYIRIVGIRDLIFGLWWWRVWGGGLLLFFGGVFVLGFSFGFLGGRVIVVVLRCCITGLYLLF